MKKLSGRTRYAAPLLAAGLVAGSPAMAACGGNAAPHPCTTWQGDPILFGGGMLISLDDAPAYANPADPKYRSDWDGLKQRIAANLQAQNPPPGMTYEVNVAVVADHSLPPAQANIGDTLQGIASKELGYPVGGTVRPTTTDYTNYAELSIDAVAPPPHCESGTPGSDNTATTIALGPHAGNVALFSAVSWSSAPLAGTN